MTDSSSPAALDRSIAAFMRYFFVHINPILHRTEYRGRKFSDYEVIVAMALHVVGQMRPSDLSRGLSIEKGSLTSVLKRLRNLGLIDRRDIPGDERSYRVALTPDGQAFVDHLELQRRRAFATLFAAMPADELAAAADGVDRITNYLKKWEDDHGVGAKTSNRAP